MCTSSERSGESYPVGTAMSEPMLLVNAKILCAGHNCSKSSVLNCYASIFSCSVTHVTQVNQRKALTLLSREGRQRVKIDFTICFR